MIGCRIDADSPAASEVTFGLQVSDDGLDGGVAAQLALNDTEDAALPAEDEDAIGILRAAAVSLVDIGPLDRKAGECLGAVNVVPQGVTVVPFDSDFISGLPCRGDSTGQMIELSQESQIPRRHLNAEHTSET